MINFLNSVGSIVAKIDHTAKVVHTVMNHIDLMREAYQQCKAGSSGQRYMATNVIELVKVRNYRVNEVEVLPEDKLPSECHIG